MVLLGVAGLLGPWDFGSLVTGIIGAVFAGIALVVWRLMGRPRKGEQPARREVEVHGAPR